ncbi:hypothetical protein Desti_1899 [Desulfomonile tiedjei DSM 6799]|uniref:Uncharacterized protein n=1 Tax=Desulfomonile tiedjei (strain ATCC 49306 / DSM 6799 / DCB-1) TaxID=706587 RepID=I4C4W6_DESTA|nr:hypothetical protein Desti_1899 [Desulfomonile tiedjei DSM 6799]
MVRAMPPCRHVFNTINDIDKMDWQGETVSKVVIYPGSWHELLIIFTA